MKSKWGWIGTIILGGAILFGALYATRARAPRPAIEEFTRSSPDGAPTPGARRDQTGELLTLGRLVSAPVRGVNSEMARTSPACRDFEDALFATDLSTLLQADEIGPLPNTRGCSPANPRAAKVVSRFTSRCAPPLTTKAKILECRVALVLARSTLATLARGSRPPAEMSDLRELADELVAGFGEAFDGGPEDTVVRLRAIADRMAELDPKLLPAVKASAMANLLGALRKKQAQAKDESDTAPDWIAFGRRVAEVEALDPRDPDLDAFRRFAETEGMAPPLVKADSLARLERDPHDWREHQVLAWANWRLGRTGDARAALREALRLNPSDPELQANWRTITRPGAARDDFRIQTRISLGLSALLR